MSPADFSFICDLVRRRSGIVVAPDKGYLVETRLAPLLREHGFDGLPQLVMRLRQGDAALQKQVVEAMTTNETLFFRDRTPFDLFEKVVLPHLMGTRPPGSSIRIWSAACSSGQEAYSLAMMLEELGLAGRGWRFEILGTDIAESVVGRAREGLYSQFEVQRGLPVRSLIRFFAQEGTQWRIDQRLRERVTFQVLNLLDDFSRLGRFDLILCRNVLIYFDDETKADLMRRLAGALAPDGFLMLGTAETPYGLTDRLARHQDDPGLLVRPDNPAAVKFASPVQRHG